MVSLFSKYGQPSKKQYTSPWQYIRNQKSAETGRFIRLDFKFNVKRYSTAFFFHHWNLFTFIESSPLATGHTQNFRDDDLLTGTEYKKHLIGHNQSKLTKGNTDFLSKLNYVSYKADHQNNVKYSNRHPLLQVYSGFSRQRSREEKLLLWAVRAWWE